MTKDQFNTALTRCIAIEADRDSGGFPCYPIIGIGGDADCFYAYDNNRQVLVSGVYVDTAITRQSIICAIANAYAHSDKNDRYDCVPVILITENTTPAPTPDDVLIYFVGLNSDGLLVFTDFDELEWG